MEFGVRGRPLLPQTSCGRAEAKKVKAPSWASLRGLILPLACSSEDKKDSLFFIKKTNKKLQIRTSDNQNDHVY